MALSGKTVSLKTVVERVYLDFGFSYSLSFAEAAEWAGSILALLKVPVSLENKIKAITIHEGRGVLPCDLESIIQTGKLCSTEADSCNRAVIATIDKGTAIVEVSAVDIVNRKFKLCGCSAYTSCDECTPAGCTPATPIVRGSGNVPEYRLEPMRWATDTFHTKMHCTDYDFYASRTAPTYTVGGNYIFTSFSEGKVLMSYSAIPTDDEGYPLIPSDEVWRNAVKWEIAYKIALKLFIQESITDKIFNLIERDRDWYVAAAVNRSKIPSIDEMESFKNSWNTLIPNYESHSNFFKNMQLPQQIYNHPYRLS